jgi:hypothetical protein
MQEDAMAYTPPTHIFPQSIDHMEGKPYGLVYLNKENEMIKEYFENEDSRTQFIGSLTRQGCIYRLFKYEKYQPM